MSGLARKRSSKWDLSEQPLYDEVHPQDDGYASKSGRPFYERESGGWRSPDLPGSKGPTLEAKDSRSKRDTELPSREYIHGIRNSLKNREDSMAWENDRDYDARMSPVLEWRQQNPSQFPRDRSRSRSRSRGRSRSPNHSLRRESGPVDRIRNRSGSSNQVCIDFNSGRCRRGDHCHFLHDDGENYDDYRDNRHRKGGSANYANIDVREYASRSGRSSSSAPCNEFLKGRCRRGASCRFDHHISSDEFSKADQENDRRKRDASPERAAEHEFRRNTDIPCKFYAAGNCRNGKTCRFSHHTQAYTSPDDRRSQEKSTLGGKPDDMNQRWDGPKWNDKAVLSDDPKISSEIDVKSGIELSSSGWSLDDRLRKSMNNESSAIINPKSNESEALHRRAENSGSRHSEKWLEDMDMSPDWNYAVKSDSFRDVSLKPSKHGVSETISNRFDDNDAILKPITLPYDDLSRVRKAIISPQSFDQNGRNPIALPFSRSSKVEQSQTAVPTNQVSSVDGKLFLNSESQDQKPSEIGSEIAPSPNLVSGEQLKNLSSLVHLLGNGQQLYANLGSNNSMPKTPFTNPEGSVLPVSGSTTHSDTQKRYNSILDSTDTRPKISPIVPEVKPETQLKISDPDGTEGVAPKSKSLNPQDPNSNSEASKAKKEKKRTEENKNEEETENPDKEKSSNGKKNKDVKGVRAFKFALVEFVKELLKPSWKEGQIGKDAYKTIVKKVVDKVTATMQGASVPQTQEKIDHYLSFSKEKLTKLVQAYVEKTPKV